MDFLQKLYVLLKEPRVRKALAQTLDALHAWLEDEKTPEQTLQELGRVFKVLLL